MNTIKSRYVSVKKVIGAALDTVEPYLQKLQIEAAEEEQLPPISEMKAEKLQSPFPIGAFSRRFWLIGGLVALIGYALHQVTSVLYLIVSGYIVAIALERFIGFRQGLGCKRGIAMGIAYLILVIFMLSGLLVLVPFIITQISKVLEIVFQSIQWFQQILETEGLMSVVSRSFLPFSIKQRIIANTADQWRVELLQSTLSNNINQFISVGSTGLKSAGTFAVSLLNDFVSVLIKIVVVLTIAVFFSLEKERVTRFLSSLTSNPQDTYTKLTTLYSKLGHWLEGQLLLCVIIGFLVALGLRVISRFGVDLPDKASLALIAGLTEFIPYIWPIIGAVPALLVALIAYGRKGLIVTFLLYRAIQAAENNIIVPTLMSRKLGVNPLVIFLCMLLGASLFGFLGILFAVPISVIVSVFFTHPRKKQRKIAVA